MWRNSTSFLKARGGLISFEDIVIASLPNNPYTEGNESFPSDDIVKVEVSNETPSVPLVIIIKHSGEDVAVASFLCQASPKYLGLGALKIYVLSVFHMVIT